MSIDSVALYTILAMTAITYATRAGGFWLMRFVPLSGRVEAWLKSIPGAVIAAVVAPAVFASGWIEALGLLLAVIAIRVTRQELVAIIVGIGSVALLRQVFP
ncbi:AzlD family protein [Oceanibaculum pacificum]|uniref:Branched-chain amino acid ABC transporter n=1 Tax=Oceanibaculum pacificum TaxID=580166 RepID=A0A154VVQ3_9PROT|nr:AzlD domain-containing protein [Oceanibaculum pacificum]KZD05392.1 hypothetical protein AUP43_11615 [Oceanibaculum pacificum]